MELKEGYKQTEIGVIPNDWEVKTVNELIDLLTDFDANGSFSSVAENVNVFDYQHFAWYVRSTDLEKNTNITNVRYVDEPSYNFLKKTALYGGELLFLKRGDIGRIYLFEAKTKHATVAPNLYLLKLNKTINSKFLFYFFNTNIGQLQLKSKNASSTLGALYKDDVKSILVAIPTLKEQTAIATALSDTDAWINSLEQLLTKKRQIKQGAMQELLQPNPEASGGWEVKKLGDVGEIITGGTPPTSINEYWNGSIPWITPTDINSSKNIFTSEREISEKGLNVIRKLQKNTLLVTCIASIGKNTILRKAGACNQQINAIVPNSNNNVDFLYYLIENNKNYILGKAGITATLMISKKDFSQILFSIPNIKEQTRIATILSDMDEEIGQLESKLEKAKQLKQGMMQELLTGRIRLV